MNDDDTRELLRDVYQDVIHHVLVTQGFGVRTPADELEEDMEDMWVKCLPGRSSAHGYLALMLADQEVAQLEIEVLLDPTDQLVDIVLRGCYIKHPMGVNHIASALMGVGVAFLTCVGGHDMDDEEGQDGEDDGDIDEEKPWG